MFQRAESSAQSEFPTFTFDDLNGEERSDSSWSCWLPSYPFSTQNEEITPCSEPPRGVPVTDFFANFGSPSQGGADFSFSDIFQSGTTRLAQMANDTFNSFSEAKQTLSETVTSKFYFPFDGVEDDEAIKRRKDGEMMHSFNDDSNHNIHNSIDDGNEEEEEDYFQEFLSDDEDFSISPLVAAPDNPFFKSSPPIALSCPYSALTPLNFGASIFGGFMNDDKPTNSENEEKKGAEKKFSRKTEEDNSDECIENRTILEACASRAVSCPANVVKHLGLSLEGRPGDCSKKGNRYRTLSVRFPSSLPHGPTEGDIRLQMLIETVTKTIRIPLRDLSLDTFGTKFYYSDDESELKKWYAGWRLQSRWSKNDPIVVLKLLCRCVPTVLSKALSLSTITRRIVQVEYTDKSGGKYFGEITLNTKRAHYLNKEGSKE